MKTFHHPNGNIAVRAFTVAELRELLEAFDQDLPVLFAWEGCTKTVGDINIEYLDWGHPDETGTRCVVLDVEHNQALSDHAALYVPEGI